MEPNLKNMDPEIAQAISQELEREKNSLVLIASENYASRAVIETQANVMTNKYAEGYPKKRYYGGCEFVDVVERLAIERAERLFQVEYVNVQPHSGSQANMAVYLSFLKPGDVILGMDLSHGGHLTHGSPVNFSGKIYKPVAYQLDPKTQLLNYDTIYDLAQKHRPRMIIAGASAYPRIIDFAKFREIADSVGAYLMVDMAHIAGLVAAELHPSPVGHADFVTTTTHKTLRGPRGGLILAQGKYGDILNKGLFPGVQGGPLMHVIAAKAVALGEALKQDFKDYQRQVILNARILAEKFNQASFDLVTGGTDNHLLLIDLTSKGITGAEAEKALGRANIVVNKNAVPYDKRSPRITSGLRIGTPALSTRGMRENEMKLIADLMIKVLGNHENQTVIEEVKQQVFELCTRFPIYEYL